MSGNHHAPATGFVTIATFVLFMIAQCPGHPSAAATTETTIRHGPLKHFVAGHRIRVEATVADPQEVTLVRCYFRAADRADYLFVVMKEDGKNAYTGILPAPSAETTRIEYLFLAVNRKNRVVRSQVFKTERNDARTIPEWQQVSGEGRVTVGTELSAATPPAGFTDSIATDVVESALRFGYVAGLYNMAGVSASGSAGAAAGGTSEAAAGGATGSAAIATSGGTATASAGVSGGTILGVTAAVVAGGAVVGLAVSGGEGTPGDGSSCKSGGGTCSVPGTYWCYYSEADLGCCSIDSCEDYNTLGFFKTSDGEYFCCSQLSCEAAHLAAVDHCTK